jgi:phage terminase Nu1 subunit (DNA packaging protein)
MPGKAGNWGGKRPGAGRKPAPGESYEAARRRKESALADLRQDEVRRRRRQFLDAEETERAWMGFLGDVRNGVLAVTSRVRAQLPHLTAHDAQVIDREIREALTAIADAVADADDGVAQ